MVLQYKLLRGFSITTMSLRLMHCKAIWVTKRYSLLALDTLARSIHRRPGRPLGHESDLSGTGPGMTKPPGRKMGMPLALLHVPQGGAMNTPRRLGSESHKLHNACPCDVVRSATNVLPPLRWICLSTPKDELRPSFWSAIVTRAEPAHISITNGCLIFGWSDSSEANAGCCTGWWKISSCTDLFKVPGCRTRFGGVEEKLQSSDFLLLHAWLASLVTWKPFIRQVILFFCKKIK